MPARNVNRCQDVENRQNMLSDVAFVGLRSVARSSQQHLCGKTILGFVMAVVMIIVVRLVLYFDRASVVIRIVWYFEPCHVENMWT